jgi:hypothetical protein
MVTNTLMCNRTKDIRSSLVRYCKVELAPITPPNLYHCFRHEVKGLAKASPTITIASPVLPDGVGMLRHSVSLVISTQIKII